MDKFTIPKLLGQSNWVTWKRQVKTTLDYFDALDLVMGSRLAPAVPEENADSKAKAAFEAENRSFKKTQCLALNIIGSSLSESVAKLVETCETAMEIWSNLHSFFEVKGEERQFRSLKQFFSHKKESTDSIAENVSKLQCWWTQVNEEMMKNDGMKFPDSVFRFKLLDSLPEEYFEFVNAWESTPKKYQTSTNLIERLRNLEIRLLERDDAVDHRSDTLALMTQSDKKVGGNRGLKTVASGWKTTELLERKQGKGIICFGCKKRGHYKRNCPERMEYAHGEKAASALAVFGTKADGWIADSGATQHMTHRRDWFVRYEEFATPLQVQCAGNGQAMVAIGKGTIRVDAKLGKRWRLCELQNVLLVPKLSLNLISLGAIAEKGYTCVLDKQQLRIFGTHCKKLFLVGHYKNGLMRMHIRVKMPSEAVIANLAGTDNLLFGHCDNKVVSRRDVQWKQETLVEDKKNPLSRCTNATQTEESKTVSEDRNVKRNDRNRKNPSRDRLKLTKSAKIC